MKVPALLLLMSAPALAQSSLTVYNQDFAVVRDTVNLELIPGVNEVRFSGVTAEVEPESVILRDPTGQMKFQILEQSYRNDPADEALLLKFFEGKEIEFEVDAGEGRKTLVKGKIIRAGDPSPIIELEKRLRFDLPGRPWFPSLGDNTILQPTLTWLLKTEAAASGSAELAYVTGGLAWNADYNLILPEQGEVFDLTGWISVTNESGKTFTNASLQLMAGDVQKQLPRGRRDISRRDQMMAMAPALMEEPAVEQKTFDDFHLYSVARPVTLRHLETKQVEFARASGARAERFYVYDGSGFGGVFPLGSYYGENEYGPEEGSRKVAVFVEFKNSADNQLGIPLPAGKVRFYRADGDRLQFVGENALSHTPKDETIRMKTGDAFDLVGGRRRVSFEKGRNRNEAVESFEISLRNRKEEPVEIRVVEHMTRWMNWEITDQSHPHNKVNAQRIEFRVPVAAGAEETVTYTVRYTW
jgi:hypothetical protein